MTGQTPTEYRFSQAAVAALSPMHVCIAPTGEIRDIGPTLERILGPDVRNTSFFSVFTVEKPRRTDSMEALFKSAGRKLVLRAAARDGVPVQLRGLAVILGDADDPDPAETTPDVFIDVSLGASLAEAMTRFGLKGADFKPNDLSIDLFYSFETQKTLLEDSQKLAKALSNAKEDAERKAYLDSMTGIPNRRALHERLDTLLNAPEPGKHFALLHIDLDKFKAVNDTFGHAAGDAILKHTAQVLKDHSGAQDMPVRIGGDEFAMILNDGADLDLVRHRAEAVIIGICQPVQIAAQSCVVGASVGIVQFRAGDDLSPDRLLMNSDIALYHAKEAGNAARVLTPEMIRAHERDARLITDIEAALADEAFVPFFQPQIDAATGTVVGLEVVARWQRKTGEISTPATFLDVALRSGLMGEIDGQVRRRAMAHFAGWRGQGLDLGKLSLNLTASNLRAPDFIETLQDELLDCGLEPQSVQLELLESILFDQSDKFLPRQCQALHHMGFSLALDDFGTGHASISTLIDAPISLLKIDRSFVSGIDSNPQKHRITAAVIAMAAQMGLDVLAEGVETDAELQVVRAVGCDVIQGFLFAPPQSAPDLEAWLDARTDRLERRA